MAALLRRFSRQPQYAAPLDVSNGLTNGLVTVNLPLVASQHDYRGVAWTVVTGTLSLPMSYYGVSQSASTRTTNATAINVTNPSTVVTVAVSGAAVGSTYVSAQIGAAGSAMQIGINAAAYFVGDSNAGLAGGAATVNTPAIIGGRRQTTPAGALDLWVNGVQQATRATGLPTGSGVSYVGGNNTGVSLWIGTIALMLAWNRALTDVEMQNVTTNPWQVFKPWRLVLPFGTSVAIVVPPSTSRDALTTAIMQSITSDIMTPIMQG